MVDSRRLRQACITTPLLLAALTASAVASARLLQVRDPAHALSDNDVAHLRADVASTPFDARLVVTTDYADSQDLARYVEKLVSEPDMVLVGLDPQHHLVQVRFGTGCHVPEASWGEIERSGNDSFRHGDWEGGAAAIFRAASDAVPAGTFSPPERVQASPGPGMLFRVIGGLLVVALLASFFFRRRSVGPSGGYGPGYGPPYGGGGYGYGPPGGGMGPVGGGLIGAGLGGLAGYELGKLEGEREDRNRDDLGSTGQSNDGGGSYDGGGGGSDWDAGGGGGGFDGGDGGGGGGDF